MFENWDTMPLTTCVFFLFLTYIITTMSMIIISKNPSDIINSWPRDLSILLALFVISGIADIILALRQQPQNTQRNENGNE